MGVTREFNRYSPCGWANGVAGGVSNVVWVAPDVYAVGAAERVLLWNVRTGRKVPPYFSHPPSSCSGQ